MDKNVGLMSGVALLKTIAVRVVDIGSKMVLKVVLQNGVIVQIIQMNAVLELAKEIGGTNSASKFSSLYNFSLFLFCKRKL
jgi:hypothetical protein